MFIGMDAAVAGFLALIGFAVGMVAAVVFLQLILLPLRVKGSSWGTQMWEPCVLLLLCILVTPVGLELLKLLLPYWLGFMLIQPLPLIMIFVIFIAGLLFWRKKGKERPSSIKKTLFDLTPMLLAVLMIPTALSALCGFGIDVVDASTIAGIGIALAIIYVRALDRLNSSQLPFGPERAAFLVAYPSIVLASFAFFIQTALLFALSDRAHLAEKRWARMQGRVALSAVVLVAGYILIRLARRAGKREGPTNYFLAHMAQPAGDSIDTVPAAVLPKPEEPYKHWLVWLPVVFIMLPSMVWGINFQAMHAQPVDLGGHGGVYGTVDDVVAPQFASFPKFVWPEHGFISSVRCEPINVSIKNVSVPALVVKDIDDATGVSDWGFLYFNLRRVRNGLQILVWARDGSGACVIDMANGRAVRVDPPNEQLYPFSLVADDSGPKMRFGDDIYIAVHDDGLYIDTHSRENMEAHAYRKGNTVPWPNGQQVFNHHAYCCRNYPLAVAPVPLAKPYSVILIDMAESKMAAGILIPQEATEPTRFVLDPETDGLIAVDERCRFMLCVDLHSVVSPAQKTNCTEYDRFDGTKAIYPDPLTRLNH